MWFAVGYVPVDVGRSLLSVGISARLPGKRLLVAPPHLGPGLGAERLGLWQTSPEQIRLKFSFFVGLLQVLVDKSEARKINALWAVII